ncbi:MAG: phosphoribosylamine--glycine ligase [Chlorobi bacterium]|nr:phosphoribosylamine--glycine ligase [Chlorobiota bacterium]
MRVVVIGSGGREHALVRALAESPSKPLLWAVPGNPGIFQHAQPTGFDNPLDAESLIAFCRESEIDLVVVGPEAPLAAGIADALRLEEIPVFGPSQAAARLESSKWYAKRFMERYSIPTARWKSFTIDEVDEARQYIDSCEVPVVIKADGLAAGKGVIIASTRREAVSAIERMFSGSFGDAGKRIVVEEFLWGEEASVFAICDGTDYVLLAPAQDHKRLYDGDRGPNTGGMGAYAPAPIVTADLLAEIERSIVAPTLQGMITENAPFVGCLYVGLMIAEGKPYVVEYNARFGDPETQSVLEVFRGDVARLLYSAARGRLDRTAIEATAAGWSCTVVLASKGYPGSYESGFPISGIEQAQQYARVYHAGTALGADGRLITAGGRVLDVTSHAATLAEAIKQCYRAVECLRFENIYYRTDIGTRALRTQHLLEEGS